MSTQTKVWVLTDKRHMRTDELCSALKDILHKHVAGYGDDYLHGLEMINELQQREENKNYGYAKPSKITG